MCVELIVTCIAITLLSQFKKHAHKSLDLRWKARDVHVILPLSVSAELCVSPVAELIYKEVLDWEERTKNGVIRGQSASIGQWSFFTSVAIW